MLSSALDSWVGKISMIYILRQLEPMRSLVVKFCTEIKAKPAIRSREGKQDNYVVSWDVGAHKSSK